MLPCSQELTSFSERCALESEERRQKEVTATRRLVRTARERLVAQAQQDAEEAEAAALEKQRNAEAAQRDSECAPPDFSPALARGASPRC